MANWSTEEPREHRLIDLTEQVFDVLIRVYCLPRVNGHWIMANVYKWNVTPYIYE